MDSVCSFSTDLLKFLTVIPDVIRASQATPWRAAAIHYMDHINSDGPPTARTQKISTNSVQFPYLSTNFSFTHTHALLVKSGGGQVGTHERSNDLIPLIPQKI